MKKAIINGGIGSKVICAVTDNATLEAAPIKGADNGDGTASLLVTNVDIACTVSEAEYEMTASAIPLSVTSTIYKYLFLLPDAGNSDTIYLGSSAVEVGHSIPIPATGLTLAFPVQADSVYVIGTALDVLYAISFEEA